MVLKIKQKMYWNKTKECMNREELKELQLENLKQLVSRLYHDVPFYRNEFQNRDNAGRHKIIG